MALSPVWIEEDIYAYMENEFTTSNYYTLTFNIRKASRTSYFLIDHDFSLTSLDGIFVGSDVIKRYDDGSVIDTSNLDSNIFKDNTIQKVQIDRKGDTIQIFVDDVQIYIADAIRYNTFGIYNAEGDTQNYFKITDIVLEPVNVADITPSVDDYDGSIFGSDWHIEFRDDHLNFVDYGMQPSGATGSGLVLVNDVALPNKGDWHMEIEITYNNHRFDSRLNKLNGKIQTRIFEDITTRSLIKQYTNTFCSPQPIPNAKTIFTRHSDEGTLYYVEPSLSIQNGIYQPMTYLCNPYIQYKGGVEIYTETGISLFDLENGYSPIYVGNDLVRAEFHRRSGYIKLSRYDEITDSWYVANILKLTKNFKLSVGQYNDDYAKIYFGNTTWEFYRGRPFIVVKHPNTDFRVMNLVDRVYCETSENEQGLGYIEEHDALMSIFNPKLSIQQFQQELHIGQNIRTDNFELYEVDSNGWLNELNHDATMETTTSNGETALLIHKNYGTGKLALNFPSSSRYVKKPSNTFSLLIGDIDADTQTSITIKARGFDENGEIHLNNNLQYGIWESSQTFSVSSSTEELRATFTCNNPNVKYLDFIVIFNTQTTSDVTLGQFMLYEGDALLNHDIDTSIKYANNVEISFYETYYANLYDEDSPVGLCVIRPNQKSIGLRTIGASDETVFAPYMKKCSEWDKPSQIMLEYLYAKQQVIDINWEEF